MSVPDPATEAAESDAPAYVAYAQLIKMLLPSSGCFAIYAVDGDLAWCSDGFERPDFRELVDALRNQGGRIGCNQGTVRQTSAGVSALAAKLCDDAGETVGFALIELGSAHGAGSSMATSLTRPFLSCLASQIALEHPVAEPPPARPTFDPRLHFLLGLNEIDLNSPSAVRQLLARCVDHLDCVSAVFCVPDHDLTEVADRETLTDSVTRDRLDATRKHLLAWVQLNNRPMVVNRIENAEAPYKILSCPVVGRKGSAKGLIALFRAMDAANFELDDVRMIEFLSRQAMALLYERQDSFSGLMSRPAFERYLEERLGADAATGPGSLLYLDVAGLGEINARHGFSAGDEVIQRTAQLIRRSIGPEAQACRLSGDRFAVHLPDLDHADALELGSQIATAAASLGFPVNGGRDDLTLAFGVAELPGEAASARHWIAAAEFACDSGESGAGASPYNASSSV